MTVHQRAAFIIVAPFPRGTPQQRAKCLVVLSTWFDGMLFQEGKLHPFDNNNHQH